MPEVNEIDPLHDSRWAEFLKSQPRASVFHSPAWLEALHRTYRYQPIVVTTSDNAELRNGLVYCQIASWWTGKRAVSLPFSDHCEPLFSDGRELADAMMWMAQSSEKRGWKYVELRPIAKCFAPGTYCSGGSFAFHELDLRPSESEIFAGFHKSCVQRKITRAKREGLSVEEGCSDRMVQEFYSLMILTRRRFHLLPQPAAWFANLRACFNSAFTIRTAYKGTQPIASILTLSFKNSVVYKYGCSDSAHHRLGAMPYLFWAAICDAKRRGAQVLDLGRSDLSNAGLIAFKDHLGARRSRIEYVRCPEITPRQRERYLLLRRAVSQLPSVCLATAGKLVYRHIG